MTKTNLTNLDPQNKLLLQTVTRQLNLSEQTLHNSVQLLMNPKVNQFITDSTKQESNQAIVAILFLSHKLHQRSQLSLVNFSEYSENRSDQDIEKMELFITKMVEWKVSLPLLSNQAYQIAKKWDNFTKHVSLIDVHFIDPYCPINLRILSQNILKLVYHKDTYNYTFQKISISLIYLTIKNSVSNLTKYMIFKPTASIDYIFNDFLCQTCQFSIQNCSKQIRVVKRIVFHWMEDEVQKQNFNNMQNQKARKLNTKLHKLK